LLCIHQKNHQICIHHRTLNRVHHAFLQFIIRFDDAGGI